LSASIEIRGHKNLNNNLYALSKKIQKPSAMYKAIVVKVERETIRQIDTAGDQFGKPWQNFKKFKWHKKWWRGRMMGKGKSRWVDTNAKLLRDTGHLRQSIRRYYTARGGKVFIRLPYAIAHDQGDGYLPKRQIIPKASQVTKLVMRTAKAYVAKAVHDANR
jgi:hypothetical protein